MSTNDDSAPMHEVLLAAVAQQTSALVTQAEHLANAAIELKGAYRFSRQLKVILATAAAAMVLLVALGVGLVILASQNHDTGARTREAVAVIRDCTDPAGTCAKRQQAQTGAAIAQIIARDVEGFLVVTECSRATTTDAELEKCVHHRLLD